ncbi:MAG: hypothetical protein SFW09_13495 [Hyphomicrobiaceae bacterium]|nr:hypothetical protein [Hyphomicrobiaceae bacterium]
MAGDGSGLPHGFWSGLDVARAQELIAGAHVPPRSAALHDLWRRLWSSAAVEAPSAGKGDPTYPALRVEALYRSGLVADLDGALKDMRPDAADPTLALLVARSRIALGDRNAGCPGVKAVHRAQSGLPKPLRSELLVLAGLCGAGNGDAAAAGLAAELLRTEGVAAPLALAALDHQSSGAKEPPSLTLPKRASLLDYRFLELAGWRPTPDLVAVAEPPLLAVLATVAKDPATRLAAGESAARLHALSPSELAGVYRAYPFPPEVLAEPLAARVDPALKRALLFRAAEGERTPMKRSRLVRALFDDARRIGLHFETAAMLGQTVADMQPAPEIGWFAETAAEVSLAARRYDKAVQWSEAASGDRGSLLHWLVLADIADPNWRGRRGASLAHVEQLAVRGRLAPELMHRLVTVLDALDYQIPIPLWEAASRTPQPSSGHLPETGVLSQLADAAKRREPARTVLLAMRTLGPDGADAAHMIALGDAIRALKRAGLEAEARRLGLEALFPAWPRTASH